MSDDPSLIGLQHPAFATSKKILLNWINDFFELNYTKVEQCATGAVYCQILDCMFPESKVPMSRVNWNAKSEYEYVTNFKIVQNIFAKKKISKPVHIDKLVKAKYQDNLEFLQWFKYFFECRYQGQEYNAKERRQKGKGAKGAVSKTRPTSARTGTKATSSATSSSAPRPAAKKTAVSASSKKLEGKVAELEGTVEGLEKERDFYFGKLREVEVLCQTETESQPEGVKQFMAQVLAILYKTDEDEGDEAAETEPAAEEAAEEDETF